MIYATYLYILRTQDSRLIATWGFFGGGGGVCFSLFFCLFACFGVFFNVFKVVSPAKAVGRITRLLTQQDYSSGTHSDFQLKSSSLHSTNHGLGIGDSHGSDTNMHICNRDCIFPVPDPACRAALPGPCWMPAQKCLQGMDTCRLAVSVTSPCPGLEEPEQLLQVPPTTAAPACAADHTSATWYSTTFACFLGETLQFTAQTTCFIFQIN